MKKMILVQVNIQSKLAEMLEEKSIRTEINKTTLINQALANAKFIHEKQKSGKRFFIEKENGDVVPVLFS